MTSIWYRRENSCWRIAVQPPAYASCLPVREPVAIGACQVQRLAGAHARDHPPTAAGEDIRRRRARDEPGFEWIPPLRVLADDAVQHRRRPVHESECRVRTQDDEDVQVAPPTGEVSMNPGAVPDHAPHGCAQPVPDAGDKQSSDLVRPRLGRGCRGGLVSVSCWTHAYKGRPNRLRAGTELSVIPGSAHPEVDRSRRGPQA